MKSLILLILTINFQAFSKTECISSYKPKEVLSTLSHIKNNDEVFFPMFVKSFETEFGVAMNEGYKKLLKKIILFPEQITPAEEINLKNGGYDNEGFSLKYYMQLNHLTVKVQEQGAEKILSQLRNEKIQLSQEDLVVLRFSKIIGRDYDLFDGTPKAVSEEQIKQMKYNFLKYFTFAGKPLSKEEFDVLFKKNITTDDPMAEIRYDLAQEYDPKVVTNKMILNRNHRRLIQLKEYESEFRIKQMEGITGNKEQEVKLANLNKLLSEDKDLRDALDTLRREYWYNEGRHQNFENVRELEDFIVLKDRQLVALRQKLRNISDDVDFKKLSKFLRPNHEFTTFIKELKEKKLILSSSKAANQKLIAFFERENSGGLEIFRLARELKNLKKDITESSLESIIDQKLLHFEKLYELANNDENQSQLELIRRTKMIKTALTEEEAKDIFRIMAYTSGIRLIDIVKYDPASKFGFCFGRAFFGNLIMLQNGIHRDSIKKVFVYGPMRGGLFGWGFHVAVMVEKEGGGFWVLDPSHGSIETIESWYAHYEKASKDGRIKMDIAAGDRFGRSGFNPASWDSLRKDYDSILNEKYGTKYKYFVDVLKVLAGSKFSEEKDKSLFVKGFDKALEMMGIGL